MGFSMGGETARRGERGAFQRWGDSKGERKGVGGWGWGLFAGLGDRKGGFSAAGEETCSD